MFSKRNILTTKEIVCDCASLWERKIDVAMLNSNYFIPRVWTSAGSHRNTPHESFCQMSHTIFFLILLMVLLFFFWWLFFFSSLLLFFFFLIKGLYFLIFRLSLHEKKMSAYCCLSNNNLKRYFLHLLLLFNTWLLFSPFVLHFSHFLLNRF